MGCGVVEVHDVDGADTGLWSSTWSSVSTCFGRIHEDPAVPRSRAISHTRLDDLGSAGGRIALLVDLQILVGHEIEQHRVQRLRARRLVRGVVSRADQHVGRRRRDEIPVVLSVGEEEVHPEIGAGGARFSTSATPRSSATPEAPSLAPMTDLVESVESLPSVFGLVSQWARNRIRFWAAGLIRAMTFWSGSESP